MALIKGNKALAAELGVHPNSITKWLNKGLIRPKKRILNTIYYDLEDVLSCTGRNSRKNNH